MEPFLPRLHLGSIRQGIKSLPQFLLEKSMENSPVNELVGVYSHKQMMV